MSGRRTRGERDDVASPCGRGARDRGDRANAHRPAVQTTAARLWLVTTPARMALWSHAVDDLETRAGHPWRAELRDAREAGSGVRRTTRFVAARRPAGPTEPQAAGHGLRAADEVVDDSDDYFSGRPDPLRMTLIRIDRADAIAGRGFTNTNNGVRRSRGDGRPARERRHPRSNSRARSVRGGSRAIPRASRRDRRA